MDNDDENSRLPYPIPFEQLVLEMLLKEDLFGQPGFPQIKKVRADYVALQLAEEAFGKEEVEKLSFEDRRSVEGHVSNDLLILFRRLANEGTIEQYEETTKPSLEFEFFFIPGKAHKSIASLRSSKTADFDKSEGWQLVENEEENGASFQKDEEIIISFSTKFSIKFKYFQCLWENCGKRVIFQELYDSKFGAGEYEKKCEPHPTMERWRVNKRIRDTVTNLAKEIPSDSRASIEVADGGCQLNLS